MQARRSGADIDTVKKCKLGACLYYMAALPQSVEQLGDSVAGADSAGSNKTTGTGKDAAKLDRETEETHRKFA